MSASYPAAAKAFTPIVDAVDYPQAAQVNAIYDEVTALEAAFLATGLAHDLKFVDATYDIGLTATFRPRDLNLSRNAVIAGNLAVTGTGAFTGTLSTTGAFSLGGVATGAAQPRCVAYNSATQTIASGSNVAITFDSEETDVGAMHSTAVNTGRITIPTGGDGVYLLIARVNFPANATGQRQVYLFKNGAQMTGSIVPATSGSYQWLLEVTAVRALVAGDYIEVFAYQDSTANMNVGSATRYVANEFQAVKLW